MGLSAVQEELVQEDPRGRPEEPRELQEVR